jgi:hypothetical protein
MQVVIAVPEIIVQAGKQKAAELLMQRICGIPLLIRTAVTAAAPAPTGITARSRL